MEYIFAARNEEEFVRFKQFADRYESVIAEYLDHLKAKYEVKDLPRCIVLTGAKTALRGPTTTRAAPERMRCHSS